MIYIKASAIHGRGLFARQFIPAGTLIGQCEGYTTTEDGDYVLWLDEVTGFRVTNDMRFINHSSEPNAVYYDDLTVVALRDIMPDEEITHHYDGEDLQTLEELVDV